MDGGNRLCVINSNDIIIIVFGLCLGYIMRVADISIYQLWDYVMINRKSFKQYVNVLQFDSKLFHFRNIAHKVDITET